MKQIRPLLLRSLSALLALVMLLAAAPMNAAAQGPKSGVTPEGICYQICTREDGSLEVEGEYVVITGISRSMTEVVIPSYIEDIPVLAIGDDAFVEEKIERVVLPEGLQFILSHAFENCSELSEIVLPSTLKSVWAFAFAGCSSLKEIVLPEGIGAVLQYAFLGCTGLERVVLPSTLELIKSGAFMSCYSLKEINLPDSLTTILSGAFEGCTSLTEITLPENLTTLESSVFSYCEQLETIHIPSSVTEIGDGCFAGCSALTEITVASGNPVYTSIDGVLFKDQGATLLQYPGGRAGAYTVPASVTAIGNFAFHFCAGLTQIDFPAGLTEIGESAFQGCKSLTHVELPEGMTYLSFSAFQTCESMTHIDLPDSLTRIDGAAFQDCISLTQIDLPKALTSLGGAVFQGCTGLTQVDLPDTLENIGSQAFLNCTSLTTVDLPDGLTMLPYGMFDGCTALSQIDLPDGLTSMDTDAFRNCISLTQIHIPANLTDIRFGAFIGCTGISEITVDPDNPVYSSVDGILYADGGTLLHTVPAGFTGVCTISDQVTTFSDYAFTGCVNLTEVRIPAGVSSITDVCFNGCTSLMNLYVADNNSYFTSVDGVLYQNNGMTLARFPGGRSGEFTIPSGVTAIWLSAFQDCENLTAVVIPDGVTTIGGLAFKNCKLLASVQIADSVTEIGSEVFSNCVSLESITWPSGSDYIPFYAFEYCKNLKEITIPSTVTMIDGPTMDCVSLTDIYFEGTEEQWNSISFWGLGSDFLNATVHFWCTPTEPEHTWDNGIVTKEPTEDAEGEKTYTCTSCGKTRTEVVSKLEHVHDYSAVVTEATCTAGGYTTYTCRCGDSYVTDETPALDHAFGEWMESKKPGCTTEGEEVRDCSRCDYYEIRSIEPTGHSYTPVVTAATCTEGGYTTYYCKCGDSYVADETEALGHKMGEWLESKKPGCIDPGAEIRGCDRCDYSETRQIDATGHDWTDWQIVREPTESAEGEERRTCCNCGKYESHSIPKLDHVHEYESVIIDPTCTEGGYTTYTCSCGDSYVADKTDPLGHDWTVVEHVPSTCTEGGYPIFECQDCGERMNGEEETPLGHNYENGTCTRCGEEDPDYEVPTEPVENPFTDVKENDYFLEPVLWAVEKGITAGTGAGQFSPNNTCTRAQVVTFLWRAMGKPEPKVSVNPFHDVAEADYFYTAVLWAVENGITSGTGNGQFSPNNPCTRDQVVTFLWRAMGKPAPEKTENPFTDVAEGVYYYEPVLWAVENGITAGTSATTFAPSNPCTRGQVVTFLYRAIEK